MPNRGSNLDILKSLFDLTPKADESYDAFCKRIVIIINNDEENWEHLPESIQLWYSNIAKELAESGTSASDFSYPDFPGMPRDKYEDSDNDSESKTPPKKEKKTMPTDTKEPKEPKEKKEKLEKPKKEKVKKETKPANASIVREKVFTEYGITFAEVLAFLKESGIEAKESSVKIVYTSATKDVAAILALGKVTDKDGNELLVKA